MEVQGKWICWSCPHPRTSLFELLRKSGRWDDWWYMEVSNSFSVSTQMIACDLQKMSLRLAYITNHLTFLIRCLQSNIVHLGLRLKLPFFSPTMPDKSWRERRSYWWKRRFETFTDRNDSSENTKFDLPTPKKVQVTVEKCWDPQNNTPHVIAFTK